STKTQSSKPLLLTPGFVRVRVPLAGNGEPVMVLNVPFAGSYHRAFTFGPLSCERFAVTEIACGRYVSANEPSLARPVVAFTLVTTACATSGTMAHQARLWSRAGRYWSVIAPRLWSACCQPLLNSQTVVLPMTCP